MSACFLEELGDDELEARLLQAGVAGIYARQLIETREEEVTHQVLHEVLEGRQ